MSEATIKIEIVGIVDLIAALNANTQALSGGSATSTAASTTKEKTTGGKTTTTKEKAPTKPKATKAEVSAALGEIKAAFGIDAARTIMSENGGFTKMADITPEHYDAIVAQCAAQISAGEDDGSETEEDGL